MVSRDALEDIRHDNYVENPGLILDAEENDAFGCPRSLPHNDTARDADDDAVPFVSQLVSGRHAQRAHALLAENALGDVRP